MTELIAMKNAERIICIRVMRVSRLIARLLQRSLCVRREEAQRLC